MGEAAGILESLMVISFGVSWPMSILKSLQARTAKGKSLFFLCMIFSGYIFALASKLVGGNINYVFFFYMANLIMVGTDILIYFRNRRLDRLETGASPEPLREGTSL